MDIFLYFALESTIYVKRRRCFCPSRNRLGQHHPRAVSAPHIPLYNIKADPQILVHTYAVYLDYMLKIDANIGQIVETCKFFLHFFTKMCKNWQLLPNFAARIR